MVPCALCAKSFPTFRRLKHHMGIEHSLIESYSCASAGCLRKFQLFNSYRRHYMVNHLVTVDSTNLIQPSFDVIQPNMAQNNPEGSEITVSCSNTSDVPLIKTIAGLVSSLYGNPQIPKNVVDTVFNDLKKVFSDSVLPLLHENSGDSKSKLRENIDSTFGKLDSHYKRLQYFEDLKTYIKPQEYFVGRRYDYVKRGGSRFYEAVECQAHIIPLREVLNSFFLLPNILRYTLDNYNKLITHDSTQTIQHFVQGSFWKSRRELHGNKLVLPIFLQIDDFEPLNALGSHSSIHKLGAAFISLPCLPECYVSQLSNIFLVLLYHSSDRTQFGNRVIFQPLINEFNDLINHGIKFDLPNFKETVYFDLGLILGDNLGIHSVTGFVESFSSNSSCRICKVNKNVMIRQFYEDTSLLRNLSNYKEDLEINNASITGVKEECVWLKVENFDLFSQIGVDVMHDLNEGVIKYILSELIVTLVDNKKYFSMQLLNNKISSFDYGPDNKDIPVSLTIENLRKGNLRLTASEVATFCRYLGIMVGDLVPRGDEYWALYIQLMLVLDVIMCPEFRTDKVAYLRCLVADLAEMYTVLFNQTLKPKFHYLLHYPSFMLKFGPLGHLSSMRFEAKHHPNKLASKASSNRRNMSLTIAKAHQLIMNDIFFKEEMKNPLSFGTPYDIPPSETSVLAQELGWNDTEKIKKVSWAKVSSTKYSTGSVVIYKVDTDYVQFATIQDIYLYDSKKNSFKTLPMNTICFDSHYYAYNVEDAPISARSIYITYESMQYPFPNNIALIGYGEQTSKYVILRKPL